MKKSKDLSQEIRKIRYLRDYKQINIINVNLEHNFKMQFDIKFILHK